MADAMRLAFADRGDLDGRLRFRRRCRPRVCCTTTYVALRGAAIVPGARINPNPVSGDPRPTTWPASTPRTMLAVAEPVTGPGETTTHFAVVDKWGNMVTYTNTIESSHGIGVFAGYTKPDGSFRNFGFLLNNELTDFNTAPTTNPYTGSAGYNDVQPNKRPRSSMTPTMIFTPDGEPLVAFGSPGGATIINSVLNVTLNLIDHKMTLQDAIDAPRAVGHQRGQRRSRWSPASRRPRSTACWRCGYTVRPPPNRFGAGGHRRLQTGKQYGAADARREGTVIGLPRPRGK